MLDAIVVGSGPVGLEAAACLKAAGRRVRILEREMLAASIFRWPAESTFISRPERVDIAGVPVPTRSQQPVSRETYLAYLRAVVELHDLDVVCHAPVTSIEPRAGSLEVRTGGRHPGRHVARALVLATGRLARPARLQVRGADRPHVHHRLDDPHRYFGQRVVVVGDGNSAVTAAARLFRSGARVTIVHRGATLERGHVRPEYRADLEMLIEKGVVAAMAGFDVAAIDEHRVRIVPSEARRDATDAVPRELAADFVLAEIGFEPELGLLEACGVRIEGGAPVHDPVTMQTNVPGIHVVGTIVAPGDDAASISSGHDHVRRLVLALAGVPARVGGALDRRYDFSTGDDEA